MIHLPTIQTAIQALQSHDGIGSKEEAIKVLEGFRDQNETAHMTHYLKTWPEYFEQVWSGKKTFEVRKDDRGFRVGDRLVLFEWNPETQSATGRTNDVEVTYILRGGQFGIAEGYCVMAFEHIMSP